MSRPTINTGPFAADGLPLEIGQYRGGLIPTNTWRLNYDRTLTPTMLLHIGAGYMDTIFNDQAPFLSFNPSINSDSRALSSTASFRA